jgi:hypothetical protein
VKKTKNLRSRLLVVLLLTAEAIALPACGGGGGSSEAEAAAGGEAPAPGQAPAPSPSAPLPVVGALAESAMPAWRQAQAVGEWRQIPNSALSSAPRAVSVSGNTGPQSKVIAWTSFIIDTRNSSIYSVANGGHHDYAGNEVNRIGLLDGTPAWTEPRAATPMSQVSGDVSHYADGRPTSRHTYYGAVMNESAMDGFNVGSNDWDAAGTYADAPADYTGAFGNALTQHRATGDIYVFGRYAVSRWSNASNSWTRLLGSVSAYGQSSASAMDTARNRILIVGGENNDRGLYDIASNTMSNVSFTGPNAGDVGGTANGMVYDPGLDVYLLRKAGAGSTIYRINAQTFYVDTLPNANGGSIPASTNGVYRRFLYVPQLKGVVYFPSYSGNGWFIRTS